MHKFFNSLQPFDHLRFIKMKSIYSKIVKKKICSSKGFLMSIKHHIFLRLFRDVKVIANLFQIFKIEEFGVRHEIAMNDS